MSRFLVLVLGVLLTGCMQGHLAVHTDYLNREHLASYHVDTPDPMLSYPMIGQRLLTQWSVPQAYLSYPDLHLEVTIRFGNRQEVRENIPVDRTSGITIYTLSDENYWEKEGIQTFKVELIGNGCVLETRKHQLWVDLINIGND